MIKQFGPGGSNGGIFMELFQNRITPSSFAKITLPAVASMVFMAFYCIVDGVFVARLIGENALAAINITLPLINLTFGVGIMLAAGGSASVGISLGEGRQEKACRDFSFLTLTGAAVGLVLAALLLPFTGGVVTLLGATPALYAYCFDYALILILSIPLAIVKTILEYFVRTDGNARLSFLLSLTGGVTNIILDYVFIVPMDMGIRGAALGTASGYLVPLLLGVLYFAVKKTGLRFRMPRWNFRFLAGSCSNGSSEMVTELSTGVTTFLFNIVTLRILGENGLSAITIILYAHYLLNSVYLGFVCGAAPAISYNYGADNRPQLAKIVRYSKNFLLVSSVLVTAFAIVFSNVLVGIFAPPGSAVFVIAKEGMMLFSGCFLFIGFNIYASGMFTAFGNGRVSALISFLRAFLFPVACIILLPAAIGGAGIWLSLPFSELICLGFTLFFLWRYRFTYHYAGALTPEKPLDA